MSFFVCDKCRAGFRHDVRNTFENIGKVKPGTNTCSCGGEYHEMSDDNAVGQHGVIDTLGQPRHKPN